MTRWLRVSADILFDGTNQTAIHNAAVLLEDDRVAAVGPAQAVAEPDGAARLHFGGCTILPGLVDCHTHLNLPGDGSGLEDAAADGDDLLLLRSANNARTALASGVTTLRENGGRNGTISALREAQRRGIVSGPRLSIAGRPLTITGGHCWPFGGEADGVTQMRQAVRQLVKEGADWIKVIATGGGTRNTLPLRPSYSPAELRAAVEEAHSADRLAGAHVTCTQGIVDALDAGFDMLIHCFFSEPDGSYRFDPEIARRIADKGVWVNPTLHVARTRMQRLEQLAARRPLTADEASDLERNRHGYEERCSGVQLMLAAGVRVVAGSDSGWSYYPFGAFGGEIDALTDAGMDPLTALSAATLESARAIGLDRHVGSLEPGKAADLLVVDGDPTINLTALTQVRAVFANGVQVK